MVIAVVAITITLGAPGVINAFQSQYVKGATESSYFMLGMARSTAISQGADITIDINDGANWCLGISDTGPCDCTQANSCLVNGVEQVADAEDFPGVSVSNVTFVGGQSVIDGMRGLAVGSAGSMQFDRADDSLRLVLSNLARARICRVQGDIAGYPAC